MKQLAFFDSSAAPGDSTPARGRRGHHTGAAGEECPHHDRGHVCDECPERYDTDGWGFVHPSLLRGRVPLQRCAGCRQLVTRDRWVLEAWRCASCAPAAATPEAPSKVRARRVARQPPEVPSWPPPGAIEWVTLTAEERESMRALLGGTGNPKAREKRWQRE